MVIATSGIKTRKEPLFAVANARHIAIMATKEILITSGF